MEAEEISWAPPPAVRASMESASHSSPGGARVGGEPVTARQNRSHGPSRTYSSSQRERFVWMERPLGSLRSAARLGERDDSSTCIKDPGADSIRGGSIGNALEGRADPRA